MNDDDTTLDELFAAAREVRPPPGAAAQGWTRMEALIAAPAAATATSTATAASTMSVGKIVLGVAVVAAIAVPLGWRSTTPTSTPPAATPTVAAPAAAPAAALPEPIAAPQAPIAAAPVVDAPVTNGAAAPRVRTASRPIEVPVASPAVPVLSPTAPTVASADALRLEAELLGRAWVAIRDGRAKQTRELLAEHARRFPSGALVPERRACEIVAACIAGERDATATATRYLAADADSHLAARVRAGCSIPTPSAGPTIE